MTGHVDGVFDALLVEVAGAGHLGVGKTEHMAAQAVHGGFMGQAGAGAGLIEGGQQGLVGQQVAVAAIAGNRLQVFSNLKDPEKLFALKILKRQDVAPRKATHRLSLPSEIKVMRIAHFVGNYGPGADRAPPVFPHLASFTTRTALE
jgi:hypothetical protein